MNPETVRSILNAYRENLSMLQYLALQLDDRDNDLNIAKAEAIIRGPNTQRLSGMPRSGGTSNPTEKEALALVSKGQHIDEIKSDMDALRMEYSIRQRRIDYVEALMSRLNPREQWVIEHHMIDGSSWKEVANDYKREFGETRSKRALQAIQTRALDKLYSVAK